MHQLSSHTLGPVCSSVTVLRETMTVPLPDLTVAKGSSEKEQGPGGFIFSIESTEIY